ncbi:hypothetical protein JCM8097_002964 [Rhodosporidiobolus ruineniae]
MLSRRVQQSALRHPLRTIVGLSLLLRISTCALLLLSHSVLPTFDPSAALLDHPLHPLLQPFVRWDTVHFLNTALNPSGYGAHEQSAAFTPGISLGVLKGGGTLLAWLSRRDKAGADQAVLAGILATFVATTGASLLLYRLTFRLFPSSPRSFALLSSTLFLLAPARATLHAVPYTEPFAALFSFGGMLAYSHGHDLGAALCWAAGSGFRAQGAVLGVGFFGWKYVVRRPFRSGRVSLSTLLTSLPRFFLLSLLSALPFLVFERYIASLYCLPAGGGRPWCDSWGQLSYGWIQREYWNIRPFAYWTPLQLPNFALAAPVLLLSFSTLYRFYRSNLPSIVRFTLPFLPPSLLPPSTPPRKDRDPLRPLTHPASPEQTATLTPYMHLYLATSLLLLTTAHVQIALRICASEPVAWWGAAELVLLSSTRGGGRQWGRRWVGYCVVWGTVSVVLWAVFLPPA